MLKFYEHDNLWIALTLPFLPTKVPPSLGNHFHVVKSSLWTSEESKQREVQIVGESQELWIMYINAAHKIISQTSSYWGPGHQLLCSGSHCCICMGWHPPWGAHSQWLTMAGVLIKVGQLLGDREHIWWPMLAGGHLDNLPKPLFDSTLFRMLPPNLSSSLQLTLASWSDGSPSLAQPRHHFLSQAFLLIKAPHTSCFLDICFLEDWNQHIHMLILICRPTAYRRMVSAVKKTYS